MKGEINTYNKEKIFYQITTNCTVTQQVGLKSTKCGVEARQILEERNCLETQIKAIENEARRRKK